MNQPDPSEDSDVPSLEDTGAPTPKTPEPAPTDAPASDATNGKDSTGEDMAPPGNSTAGFDTLLGKLVVDSGLVTADELEQCGEELKSIDDIDDPRTLSDILVNHDFITRHQLHRLQKEFDAKKSSQRIPGYQILKKL